MSTISLPPLKARILACYLLVGVGILVYFNSLGGTFQFDDRNLIEKPWIADLDAFGEQVGLKEYKNRPVLLLTLALNNTLHPNRVLGFHLINLVLHLWVTLLIFFILLKTQSWVSPQPAHSASSTATDLALPLLTALLFVVHPLNTDSVSYISSRSTLLATFFYLAALYAFLSLFSARPLANRFKIVLALTILLPLLIYLALASKLIAVTLPAALALCFFAFVCPQKHPGLWNRLRQRKTLAFGLGGMLLAVGAVLYFAPGFLYAPKDQGLELYGRGPYFWMQMKVIVFYYLKLFAVPFNLNVDAGFPFSSVFSDPTIVLALLLLIALSIVALRFGNLWVRVGVLWFLLALAPTSTLVPLNDLAVEHRMYLPTTLGLGLIAGWGLRHLLFTQRRAWVWVLLILLGAGALDRNRVWIDEKSLWSDAVKKNPHSPRTHNNLGKAHYESGDLKQALRHFKQSVANIPRYTALQYNLQDPAQWLERKQGKPASKAPHANRVLRADLVEPHYNLASVYLDLGQLDRAAAEYQTTLGLHPNHYGALLGLGSIHARLGSNANAEKYYLSALAAQKAATGVEDDALARLNLGELYGKSGRFEAAVEQFHRAVKSEPSLALAHYNLGVAYSALGKLQQAEHWFASCLSLNADFEPALFNLAQVLQKKKQWDRSTETFERFLRVKGPDARAHYHIGWNHQQMGRLQQAQAEYEKSLALNPPPVQKQEITRLLQNLS